MKLQRRKPVTVDRSVQRGVGEPPSDLKSDKSAEVDKAKEGDAAGQAQSTAWADVSRFVPRADANKAANGERLTALPETMGPPAPPKMAPWMTRLEPVPAKEKATGKDAASSAGAPTQIGAAPAPESVKGEIASALQALADIPGLDPAGADVKPLEGGATNQLFVVDLPDEGRFVLRIAGPEQPFIDRARDVDATRQAHAQGLGPELRYASADSSVQLVEFIDAKPINPDALGERPELLKDVAAQLASVHDGPAPGGEVFDPFTRITQAADKVRARGMMTDALEEALSQVAELEPRLRPFIDGSSTACHNDTNPGNILVGEQRTWLIDWDYAGRGDPFYDLGCFAACLQLDDKQSEALVSAYRSSRGDDVQPEDGAHLELQRLTNTLWASLWFQAKSDGPGDLNETIGLANLKDFSDRVSSPGYAEALQQLSDNAS